MVLDYKKDLYKLRDWMVRPVLHPASALGAAPHQFQDFVGDLARAVDGGVREVATRRKLKVSGFPAKHDPGATVAYRSPAVVSWDASSLLRPRFRVEIRQDTTDLSKLEVSAHISFPVAMALSVAMGLLFEALFWPPPNILRPWSPIAIGGVATVVIVVFAYALKRYGYFGAKSAAFIAGVAGVLSYLFWPLWLGMFLGFMIGMRTSKMLHEDALRASLEQALSRVDAVPGAYAPKVAKAIPVAPPPVPVPQQPYAPPVAPSAPPAPAPGPSCPVCGTPAVAGRLDCPTCGFAGVG